MPRNDTTGSILGFWLLLYSQYWMLTRTPLVYPVALCHGDRAAVDLQDLPLHLLQQFIVLMLDWNNSNPCMWIWVGAKLINHPVLLKLLVVDNNYYVWAAGADLLLTCAYTTRVNSTLLPRQSSEYSPEC